MVPGTGIEPVQPLGRGILSSYFCCFSMNHHVSQCIVMTCFIYVFKIYPYHPASQNLTLTHAKRQPNGNQN